MTQPAPMMELVPKPEKPNEFAVFVMDHIFNPVEQEDWRVEQILVHPEGWELFRKNYKADHLDLIVIPELLKIGHRGHLFGASIQIDNSVQRGHMEVVYGDLQKRNCVCLMTKRLAGAECDNPLCVVDYVHDM